MVWPLPQDGPRSFYRTGSLGDYFSTSIEQAPSVPGLTQNKTFTPDEFY